MSAEPEIRQFPGVFWDDQSWVVVRATDGEARWWVFTVDGVEYWEGPEQARGYAETMDAAFGPDSGAVYRLIADLMDDAVGAHVAVEVPEGVDR